MKRYSWLFVLVLAVGLAAGPARAQVAVCDGMVMPVTQLKTIGRGYSRYHSGVDLMAPYGSPVLAAADGVVVYAGRYYAYGNIVDLRHDDGSVTRYAHLSRFVPGIRPGTVVRKAQQIAFIGTSGNAHGAHLHFEVQVDGHAIDPEPMIALASCTTPVAPTRPLRTAEGPRPGATFIDARPGGIFQ